MPRLFAAQVALASLTGTGTVKHQFPERKEFVTAIGLFWIGLFIQARGLSSVP